jgi:2-polyprenyl-3-methyl-5-hydroxy-6-metoxy-1,4-benzoquinol methylase
MFTAAEMVRDYQNLSRLVAAQLAVWPEHDKYLQASFSTDDENFLERVDDVSKLVLLLVEDRLQEFCEAYRFMSENFIEEELFFRRHKRYRLSTFEEANREIYSNAAYMSRYVKGILLSQVFWRNHASALDLFRTRFLPNLPDAFDHVEVGPGHGLFLSRAALDPRCKSVTGWDVSPASIAATTEALAKFGITGPVKLVEQDIRKAPSQLNQFDSAIISEVLEHLERPDVALHTLFECVRSGGQIFINIPINSPAPDHIYLWRTAAEVADLITTAGFQIGEFHELPTTGITPERARKIGSAISCVVFARKP